MQTTVTFTGRTTADAGPLLSVAQRSTQLRSKAGLRHWLASDLQNWIPHAFVVIAWGDPRTAAVSHEVIAPSLEAAALRADVSDGIRSMFERWHTAQGEPIVLRADEIVRHAADTAWPADARYVLAHGITDRRGAYECMYAFFGPEALCASKCMDASRVLLPFIDAGFRQLTITVEPEDSAEAIAAFALPSEPPAQPAVRAGSAENDLSEREREVMQWVRLGKTNSEIGSILNLSTFTVKNHMCRIYKKLDVLNRAQAVGRLERLEAGR